MPRRRNRFAPGPLWVLLALALILGTFLLRAPAGSALWRVLAPVMAARESLGGSGAQLRAELASTTAALESLRYLAQENAQLRAELNRAGSRREVAAGVIARPPGTPYDTLMVDAGSSEGVREGAQVFAAGAAIGQVDTVYATSARVLLYSSPGQTYQALLTAPGGKATVLSVAGQGAGSMSAQVPAATPAHVGDAVAFPGLGGALSGRVSAVDSAPGDSFKTVYLQVPVNVFQLQYVFIAL